MAIAASIALPPLFKISAPTWEAILESDTTQSRWNRAGVFWAEPIEMQNDHAATKLQNRSIEQVYCSMLRFKDKLVQPRRSNVGRSL